MLASASMLFLLLPLLAALALVVAMDGGPVLFRHRRIGRDGVPFDCLKFRSMIDDAEASFAEFLSYHPGVVREWETDRKLRFDPRVTAVGRMMRSTSLDELPQLVNVLFGDMSLVGPRPVTQVEVIAYGDASAAYQRVRPGITGLWQVSGRNDVDFATRVAIDERYVRDSGLLIDLRILLMTPSVVLRRRGAR